MIAATTLTIVGSFMVEEKIMDARTKTLGTKVTPAVYEALNPKVGSIRSHW